MRFQNVKSASEVALPGVGIELEHLGDSLKSVSFSVDGKFVFRVALDSYNLYLQRIADPKTKEVYRVAGTVLGLPVSDDFDDKWSADQEADRLRRGVQVETDAAITVEKVKIEIAE